MTARRSTKREYRFLLSMSRVELDALNRIVATEHFASKSEAIRYLILQRDEAARIQKGARDA